MKLLVEKNCTSLELKIPTSKEALIGLKIKSKFSHIILCKSPFWCAFTNMPCVPTFTKSYPIIHAFLCKKCNLDLNLQNSWLKPLLSPFVLNPIPTGLFWAFFTPMRQEKDNTVEQGVFKDHKGFLKHLHIVTEPLNLW